jgi:hypothetical protein
MFGKKQEKISRGELREERFKRVASRRVQEILDKLRLLGNCSDKANYSYTEEQVRKIFSAIDEELKKTKFRFNHKTKSKENRFTL